MTFSYYYYLEGYEQARYYIDKAMEIRKKALPSKHMDFLETKKAQKMIYSKAIKI